MVDDGVSLDNRTTLSCNYTSNVIQGYLLLMWSNSTKGSAIGLKAEIASRLRKRHQGLLVTLIIKPGGSKFVIGWALQENSSEVIGNNMSKYLEQQTLYGTLECFLVQGLVPRILDATLNGRITVESRKTCRNADDLNDWSIMWSRMTEEPLRSPGVTGGIDGGRTICKIRRSFQPGSYNHNPRD
ncbi:hypothetical protein NC651_019134 [Populus alba x Populus x berolinensis]|nr:hypothetical protein NC651_019134 [Populus alba x Populus x berolinensis]